jgi:hypothetical protein
VILKEVICTAQRFSEVAACTSMYVSTQEDSSSRKVARFTVHRCDGKTVNYVAGLYCVFLTIMYVYIVLQCR